MTVISTKPGNDESIPNSGLGYMHSFLHKYSWENYESFNLSLSLSYSPSLLNSKVYLAL